MLPRTALRGAAGALELSTAEPAPQPGSVRVRRARRGPACRQPLASTLLKQVGRSACPSCAPPTGCSSDADLRTSTTPADSSPTCSELGICHLYLSPVCRRARARPTATTSSTRGGLARARRRGAAACTRAATPAWASSLDTVPNHMAADAENPLLGRPGAARAVLRHRPGHRRCTGASSTSTSWRACARRIRRFSRRPTSKCCTLVREGVARRAADRPSGRAGRPRRLPAAHCATAAWSGCGWRRSCRAGEALARLAGRGHGRL